MKRFATILPALLLVLAAVSCDKDSQRQATIDRHTPDKGPVMLNVSPDAVRGELLLKVSPSALTRGIESETLTEGPSEGMPESIESVLETAGSVRYERLFTVDPRFEERTRAEGLDRWWKVVWDSDTTPEELAGMLCSVDGIEVIECTLPVCDDIMDEGSVLLDEGDEFPLPVAGRTPCATKGSVIAATTPFDDPYVNQMRQWDFNNTGMVGTAPSEPGADANVWRAWELCQGSRDVIVGVFDQGVKYDHEDLSDNMWINEGEIPWNGVDDDGNGYVDDLYGWNFIDNSPVIGFDGTKTHGTHVAGTIAAVNNNGKGVCGIAGGSGRGDGVRIMTLQMMGSTEGSSSAGISGNIRALKYAADNGAVISQNSWGYGSGKIALETWKFGTYSAYTDALKYFIKYAGMGADGTQVGPMAGGIVVCSSGNDATADLLHYPSSDENVISVSATRMDGAPAYYTNYAAWVTLSAPGGDSKHNSQYGQILSTDIDADGNSAYGFKQGTSMAAPHVSGALALAISYFWGEEKQKGLTPAMLKAALLSSTTDVNRFCPDAYRRKMGLGSLDTYALLKGVKMAAVELPALSLRAGEERSIALEDYFLSSSAFSCSVADEDVAGASISRGTLSVKGLGEGSTTISVSDTKGMSKDMKVTVGK